MRISQLETKVKELVQRIALDDNKLEERMSELEKREKKS